MNEKLMRDIELASWKDIQSRVDGIKRSLEIIYGVELRSDLEDVPLNQLYPTEDFLENDKLTLVFMKIIVGAYDVPIIVVKSRSDYFVLDGHHRTFVHKKLRDETIKAYVLKFPGNVGYRDVPKRPLEEFPIKEVSVIDDSILSAWQRTLHILRHYEAIYNVSFYLKKEQVHLNTLVPTQSEVLKTQINAIKELLVPIVCIHYQEKYYILDGHARAIRAKQLKLDLIDAIVLLPAIRIDFGIVKTAKEMKLRSVEDVKIMPH
jgi:hypothetical protein